MKLLGMPDVRRILGCSESKAYQVIRALNAELAAKGFMTLRGKIEESYLIQRFDPNREGS